MGIFDFDLIPQLELLKLRHNEIRLIEDQSFYNLTNLKQIKLDNNKLEFWRREWFVNTTALEVMHFQFNKIKTIPKRAFVGFGKLRVIFFDNNDISEIQPDAFKEIRSLEYLGLGHNKLTVLEDYSFPNTLRIRAFVISGNYLNYLSNAVLKKLAAVEMVMDYNPWKCPCLERIYYWLYIKNGKIKIPDNCIGNNVPVCAAPSGFSDSCVDTVDSELTQRYLSTLKNISPAVDQNCFRLE
ncbi:hypothetical protein NQ314_019248 [Rhamnusium bicolor]|uniref:Uncharacterized protein n=1 Tax=Rhamnusium bicolor TaxID=1586634 RepID=A0AAV8WNZ5_9CUCU|nr:hypothetical protein NQ314_019248 [Rhamnusium bicolor]